MILIHAVLLMLIGSLEFHYKIVWGERKVGYRLLIS